MKKRLIATALMALGTTAAQAEVSVGIGINQPAYYAPVYVEPARAYYPTYNNDRHRNYDWSYWRPRTEVRYVETHRDYDHGDRDHEMRHDNGNRGNYQQRGNSGKSKGHK